MVNLERVKQKEEIAPNLEFGRSTMHSGIRLMENVLHISYNRDICKSYMVIVPI